MNGFSYLILQSLVRAMVEVPMHSYFLSAIEEDWHRSRVRWPSLKLLLTSLLNVVQLLAQVMKSTSASLQTVTRAPTHYGSSYSIPSGIKDRKIILAGTLHFTPVEVEVPILVKSHKENFFNFRKAFHLKKLN